MNKILKSGMMLALALLAMSCNKEELPGNGEEVNGGVLTINVVDKGYASQDSVPETKATTNGSYLTKFGEGDEIGVYVVSSLEGNQILLNNEKLTYSSSGWTGDLRYKKIEGDSPKFFAYYPYDASVSVEKLTTSASDAEGFFATYLSEIVLPTDQSDAGKYSKADIMVGDGVLAGTALTFGMEHQMGLVVIELPVKVANVTKYSLQGDASYTWLADNGTTLDVSSYTFTAPSGIQPYLYNDGAEVKTYRYLIKPNSRSSIQGGFTVADSDQKSYTLATSSVVAGSYKTFKVNVEKKQTDTKTHTLAVGDFFMKDGSLVKGTTSLSTEQKENCIGIVFSTENPTNSDSELKKDYPYATHGLVMSLTNASTGSKWCIDYDTNETGVDDAQSLDECINSLSGYKNSKYIWNTYSNSLSEFPVFSAAKQYTTILPGKTSCWFVPSVGQWIKIYANLGEVDFSNQDNISAPDNEIVISNVIGAMDVIDNHIKKVEGVNNVDLLSTDIFWTSNEYSYINARHVNFSSSSTLRIYHNNKIQSHSVRCILAF